MYAVCGMPRRLHGVLDMPAPCARPRLAHAVTHPATYRESRHALKVHADHRHGLHAVNLAAVVATLREERQVDALLVAAVDQHDRMVVRRPARRAELVIPERPAIEIERREAVAANHMFAARLEGLSEA